MGLRESLVSLVIGSVQQKESNMRDEEKVCAPGPDSPFLAFSLRGRYVKKSRWESLMDMKVSILLLNVVILLGRLAFWVLLGFLTAYLGRHWFDLDHQMCSGIWIGMTVTGTLFGGKL